MGYGFENMGGEGVIMNIDPMVLAMSLSFQLVNDLGSRLSKDPAIIKEEKLLYVQACRTLAGFLRMHEVLINEGILDSEEARYNERKSDG